MKRHAALAAMAAAFAPRISSAQQRAPRKVGLTAALTGPFASISVEYIAGYKLAVQHVNERGGINGRPVVLLIEDSKANPADGIAAMRKLVEVDNVEGIITFLTNVATAQLPLADQLRVPAIAGIETSGIVDKSQYMFACGVRIAKAEPLFVNYWKQHGMKRLYAFIANNAVGQAISPVVTARAKEAGAEVQIALINLADTDFRGEVARAKDDNPDGIYINTSASATVDGLVVHQLREIGMNQRLYFPANFYSSRTWRYAVSPYAEDQIFGGARLDPKAAEKFIHDYRAQLGFEPSYIAGELYDGAMMLLTAMGKASTREGIRDALASLKGVPSVLGGTLSMGSDHYTDIPNIALWQVRHGVEVRIG